MGKLKLLKNILILDRNLASKWRVGNNHVEIADRAVIAKNTLVYTKRIGQTGSEILCPLMRRKQGICLQNVSAAIVVHDHVHLGGLYQIGVDVKAEIVCRCHFRNSVLKNSNRIRVPILPLDTEGS